MACIVIATQREGAIKIIPPQRKGSAMISSSLVCVMGDSSRIQLMTNANNAVVTADQYVILTKKSEDNGNLRK